MAYTGMSRDRAVAAYRSSIESRVRHDMAEKLLAYIRILETNKYPETYIQGMERAVEVILHCEDTPTDIDD